MVNVDKCLCDEWTAVREQNTYYFGNLVFSEERTDFCYSVPIFGKLWTYGKIGKLWTYGKKS